MHNETTQTPSSHVFENLKILVADDHSIFRSGLVNLLKGIAGITKIDEVADGSEVLQILKKNKYDVLFLDIEMPKINGIEAMEEIQRSYPHIKVIVLTMFANDNYILEMYTKGVNGYLLKNTTLVELKRSIELVMENEQYYCPEVADILLKILLDKTKPHTLTTPASTIQISSREKDVLLMICNQFSSSEIAEMLYISEHTVKRHRYNLLDKIGARNSVGLAIYAIKNGLKNIS